MTTVSVLVAIYNVEKYLNKCLSSLKNQTIQDIEIICVDDGSTDSSGKICEEYACVDSRFRVIHQENKGLVRARKRALKEAMGEYICFVDGDDYVDETFCEKMLELIQGYNVDFVSTGYYIEDKVVHNKNNMLLKLDDESRKELVAEQIGISFKYDVATSIWSKIFKAEFIRKCYERVPDYQSFGEDLLCAIHCFLEAKCMLISDLVNYHYVVRKDSLTHRSFREMVTNELSLVKEISNILDKTQEIASYEKMLDYRVKQQVAFFLKSDCEKRYVVQLYELEDMTKLLGKKIVLYGAGIIGQDYYTQLSKYPQIEIVAWIDKCTEKYKFEFFEVQRIDHIHSIEFDIVLICVNNENVAQEMIRTLSDMGIDREKILWCKPKKVFENSEL